MTSTSSVLCFNPTILIVFYSCHHIAKITMSSSLFTSLFLLVACLSQHQSLYSNPCEACFARSTALFPNDFCTNGRPLVLYHLHTLGERMGISAEKSIFPLLVSSLRSAHRALALLFSSPMCSFQGAVSLLRLPSPQI